jgi:hypothetical protein
VPWHPHCLSLLDPAGDPVDVSAMPEREWASGNLVHECGWLDTSLAVDPESELPACVCPSCGGSRYELVEGEG